MDDKYPPEVASKGTTTRSQSDPQAENVARRIDDPFVVFVEWEGEPDTLAYAEL